MGPTNPAFSAAADANTLRALVEASAFSDEGTFFDALVVRLTRLIGARYAFVGELLKPKLDSVRMLAFAEDGQLRTAEEYPLEGSPCAHVIGQKLREYTGRVWEQFPEDEALEVMQIECYMGVPVFDAQGDALGIVAVLHDDSIADTLNVAAMLHIIAAHCGSEIARARALQRVRQLAALARDTPQAVIEISSDLERLATNPSADDLISSVLGVNDLRSHAVWDDLSNAVRAVVANGVECRFEQTVGERFIRWLVMPSRTGDAIHAFPLDVTNVRELERQLRHGQRMQAVGALAGGVAHDFNNHLLIIGANAELALASCTDENRELLEDIVTAADSAANVTRQLLTLSHSGDADRKPSALDDTVKETMRLVSRTTPRRIELEVALDCEHGRVTPNRSQIANVVINLCRNAVDAVDGPGTLKVRTERFTFSDETAPPNGTSGEFLVIHVQDDGAGMTREVRERALEPFFTTKPVGHGTGLGLASVQAIAKDAGGFIELASGGAGGGTRVSVFLPAYARARSDNPSQYAESADRSEPVTVFVVEDDPLAQRALARMLKQAGHTVITASDGIEAVEIFAANVADIDVALLDMDLPKRTGDEVAEAVAKMVPDLPCVFMTGVPRECPGVMLCKPFSARDVLRALSEARENA